mmetsp:Transcript_15765/g.38876  ORF Transcript_15765/g.38876 Transcript_15765/m.38876 type:complete len:378 (-) Transcript_15765:448-1581(-)
MLSRTGGRCDFLANPALYATMTLVFFSVTQSMLTAATRSSSGRLEYQTTSAVFLQEMIKLCFSTCHWYNYSYRDHTAYDGLASFNIFNFILYMVPGLTYAIQNSISYYAIALLGPPTYQVMGNFKIVITVILFRMILHRKLTIIQWLAVVLLFLSMVISKMTAFTSKGDEVDGSWSSKTDLQLGFMLVLINSCLSAFSGVFNEWLIKRLDPEAPLQFKNMQLYFFGVFLNIIGGFVAIGKANGAGFFTGFTPLVWIIILNNAGLGISVAFIMKFANNVYKCFAGAVSVYLSTYLSSLFFGERIDLPFVCGVINLSVALYMYMGDHNKILKEKWTTPESPTKIQMDSLKIASTTGAKKDPADLSIENIYNKNQANKDN